jgi:hypothetical protein
MTRARLAATAVLAAALLAGTTACSTGADVTTKPNKQTASKGKTTSKEKTAETSKAPEQAKVGDTITLKGMEDGSKLDVTVVKAVDNAKSSVEGFAPESGNRWIGVQFRLVNTGTKAYNDSPANGAQVADAEGQQFGPMFADITAGPSMSSDVRLAPGGKALGWVVFEAPTASKIQTVQVAMDSGFSDQTGQWDIG